MEYIESFLKEVPFFKALSIVALSAILWHGIKAFIDSYVRTRSKSLAEDVNLQAELRRLILNEETKLTVQRLNTEKALGAMKILRLLAEAETKLTDWQLTVYFRMDELNENETIEDLGSKDLKNVSNILVEIISETNAYVVLLGEEIYKLILNWVKLNHDIIFGYETTYQTSKKINAELDPKDKQRVTTVSQLLENEVFKKFTPIGKQRQEIMGKLSQSVHSTLGGGKGSDTEN